MRLRKKKIKPSVVFYDKIAQVSVTPETGQFLASQKVSKYSGYAKAPAFSRAGKRFAIGSDTEVITVWSVEEIFNKSKVKLIEG